MSVINSIPLIAAGDDGYQISRSVRLRSSASAYFNRTPASAGSQTTWTMSMWVKRGALGVRQFITMSGANPNSSQVWQVEFDANNKLDFYNQTIGTYRRTTQVFRDTGAWYHIVFGADTSNATAQNRFRCWVNGVEVTAWDVNSIISSGYSFAYNGAYLHGIGAYTYNGNGLPFDGYLTEVNFIDGQALTPSSFGETDAVTGVWKPKKYAGTYGTNGFYLNFSDNSNNTAATIGKDYSGNGNNWTPNNISVTAGVTYDSMLDTPTPYADGGNGRGNYCTLNPLSNLSVTISEGNLKGLTILNNADTRCNSTIAVSSGKWYFETYLGVAGTNTSVGIGQNQITNQYPANDALSFAQEIDNARKGNNNTFTAYGTALVAGDIFMCAFDLENNKIFFGKNGTWFNSSNPETGTSPAFTLTAGLYTPIFRPYGNTSGYIQANFGQRPFAYTPPTGFKALNTQNLPDATIKKGNQYFDATTYTGNGGTQSIVNAAAFAPDLVWLKGRSVAYNHGLFDSVRGTGKSLSSSTTGAEVTNDVDGYLSAFNSNGFTLTAGSTSSLTWNQNAASFVGWQWKESVTAGFDIVTYTGNGTNRTIAHSLGVAPSMMILKMRSGVDQWPVYHARVGNTGALRLNLTDATSVSSLYWNNTSPTSSVFSLGSAGQVNASSSTYVAYLFAEVAGYSKFGSYTGNGSADGPFVYCGFRPRWIMVKATDIAGYSWEIFDVSRNPSNVSANTLHANVSDSEYTTLGQIDILSNGFKPRNTRPEVNNGGSNYIYAAFAENPFKNSLAR